MSEPKGLANTGDLPGDGLEQDNGLVVILPDLRREDVIHRLQELPVRDAREEESWVLEDVSAPRLIHQLVADDHVPVTEGLGHEAPECCKLVHEPVVILVKSADRM